MEIFRNGANQQLDGCLRDFRNKPVSLKIEYYQNSLTVYYNDDLNNDMSSFEICSTVSGIYLPKNGHFGVSADTGLADVLSFITHSLTDKTKNVSNF